MWLVPICRDLGQGGESAWWSYFVTKGKGKTFIIVAPRMTWFGVDELKKSTN
jgi:hypothetical protein